MDQGRSQLNPPRPAAGEPPRSAPSEFRQFEVIDRGLCRRSRSVRSVDLCAETQILEDREVCVEREPLRHVADALADLPRLAHDVEPEHMPMPRVRFEDPCKYS